MKLEDIVKQKGLEIEKEEKKAKPSSSPSNLGRRYFWDEEAPETKATDKPEPVISQPLDSNKPANRQEKSPLASHSPFDKPVISQPLDSNKPVNFNEIIGDEKQFLIFIFKQLEFQAKRETLPITTDELKTVFNKKAKAISNLIERLVGKKVLLIPKSARGNASWRIFSLNEKTFKEIRDFNSISQSLASNYPFDKPVHWTGNEPYSNSNLNKDINIKEAETTEFQIPDNLRSLGIAQKSLQAIVKEDLLDFNEIQESLNSFSFDISKNVVKNKTAGFFFGILRNKTPYISSQYAQDQERAIKEQVAKYQAIQSQREQLVELKLREDFEAYKLKNPNFLDEVKAGNSFLAKSNPNILNELGFSKFKELIGTPSQNENP